LHSAQQRRFGDGFTGTQERNWLLDKIPESERVGFDVMARCVLDGFYWLQRYYVAECPSWTWYYPFKYSPPLSSVLNRIAGHRPPEFELGAPNLPFIQQLATFPPQSVRLLPTALQPLMSCFSPIADLYPEDFEIQIPDQENLFFKTPLIPEVDYARIRDAYESVVHNITPEEAKRNRYEKPLAFEGGQMKSIDITGKLPFEPICDVIKIPACMPSIENFGIEVEERQNSVRVFERESHVVSLFVTVKRECDQLEDADILGREILVDWPYLRPARVVKVERNNCNMCWRNDYRKKWATDIGEVKVIFEYCGKNRDGSESRVRKIPGQLCTPIDHSKAAFLFRLSEDLPPAIGQTVVCCGDTWCVGKVVGSVERCLKVRVSYDPHLPASVKTLFERDEDCWVKMEAFVEEIGISYRALHRAMSCVLLDIGAVDQAKANIAFALYRQGTDECVVVEGYCKGQRPDFLFPEVLIGQMGEYFQKTGCLKELLVRFSRENGADNRKNWTFFTNLSGLFGGNVDFQQRRFKGLIDWMHANAPACRSGFTSGNDDVISDGTLKEVEKIVKGFRAQPCQERVFTVNIKDAIWREKRNRRDSPRLCAYMENNRDIKLGVRVISIFDSSFGEYGTVIQVNQERTTATVIFDNVLECGTKLCGRLLTNRGMRLRASDLVVVK
jgi:hypothetical protein